MIQAQDFLISFTLTIKVSPGRLILPSVKQKSQWQDQVSQETKARRIYWLAVLLTISSQVKCSPSWDWTWDPVTPLRNTGTAGTGKRGPITTSGLAWETFFLCRPETSFDCSEAAGKLYGKKRGITPQKVASSVPPWSPETEIFQFLTGEKKLSGWTH